MNNWNEGWIAIWFVTIGLIVLVVTWASSPPVGLP